MKNGVLEKNVLDFALLSVGINGNLHVMDPSTHCTKVVEKNLVKIGKK